MERRSPPTPSQSLVQSYLLYNQYPDKITTQEKVSIDEHHPCAFAHRVSAALPDLALDMLSVFGGTSPPAYARPDLEGGGIVPGLRAAAAAADTA